MKHFPLLCNALALTFALAGAARACRCLPPPAPKIALEKSAAVFAGKVTSTRSEQSKNAVTFTVSKNWKGASTPTISVTTANSSAACGIGFKEGDEYLVYATKSADDATLTTNMCTRTKSLADASEDLTELGDPMPAVDPGSATTSSETGTTQLNAFTLTDSARPLALLLEALRAKSADSQIRVSWKFDWHLHTFPPTVRSGTATALYNPRQATLTLYSQYSDALGNYVKHVRYSDVTETTLHQLADANRKSRDAMENFAFFDKLPQFGARATDLGSVSHKRRVFNLK